MHITFRAAALAAIPLLTPLHAQAEPWSTETLEQRAAGFLQETWQARLEQVAQLLAAPEANQAMLQVLHGDHREYTARIRGLLSSLTHERWVERERAERTLIEVGTRARDLLQERAQSAETLEERWRTQRVLQRIMERGTEDEDRRIKLMRGYALVSLNLPNSEPLRRSLLSALGHTDSAVVNHALRALGHHGTDAEVGGLARQVEGGSVHRLTALCALARTGTKTAQETLLRLFDEGKLNEVEALHVLRVARARGDVAWFKAKLGTSGRALFKTALALELPAVGASPDCTMALVDRTALTGRFGGLSGDAAVVGNAIPGLAQFEAPFTTVGLLQFAEPVKNTTDARVFLVQGSMLHGKLLAIDPESVQLDNPTLGRVVVPRGAVQGIILSPDVDRLIGASQSTDRVKMSDNSSRDCELVSYVPARGFSVREAGADKTLATANVSALLLRRPGQTTTDATQYTRLTLRNGDRLLGHVVAASPSHIGFVLPIDSNRNAPGAVIECSGIATIEFLVGGGASWGYTIIADYSENRVLEVDEKGRVLFKLEEIFGAWDIECLDNGNVLVTEFSVSRVQEINRATGKPVWVFEDLKNPYDADRLQNGNTLIADTFGNRVIEVDAEGKIIWQFAADIRPFDCDRLANGNTLIADGLHERVIEVNREGQIVWEQRNLKLVHDADRLPNGNTLITLREARRVIEIDREGTVVFELKNLNNPSDADRLPNGNTLVAENGMVREFDRGGLEVWRQEVSWAVEANRY
jgi:hypothetical protein